MKGIDKNKLLLPIAIVVSALILSIAFYAIQISKQNSIEKHETAGVKLGRCKAEAKNYADDLARTEYLNAAQAYANKGLKEEAAIFTEASIEPKHPASYDNNYNEKYSDCLKN